MNSADLVARLRDWANTYEEGHHHPVASRMFEAADRIEALEARLAEAMEVANTLAEAITNGFTDNGKDEHRIALKSDWRIEGGYLVGSTADDIRNTFVEIRNIARRLYEKEDGRHG